MTGKEYRWGKGEGMEEVSASDCAGLPDSGAGDILFLYPVPVRLSVRQGQPSADHSAAVYLRGRNGVYAADAL